MTSRLFSVALVSWVFAAVACQGPNYTGPVGCVNLWNKAVDARVIEAPAESTGGFVIYQRDWEGDTPMCWLSIATSRDCHGFSFDVNGKWTPAEWRAIEQYPGACIFEAPLDRYTVTFRVVANGTLIED